MTSFWTPTRDYSTFSLPPPIHKTDSDSDISRDFSSPRQLFKTSSSSSFLTPDNSSSILYKPPPVPRKINFSTQHFHHFKFAKRLKFELEN